jgi:glucokinase
MAKIAYGGLDLGGTSLKYGLVSKKNEIIFFKKANTGPNKSREEILQLIRKAILDIVTYAEKENFVLNGIGMGTPGSVDIRKGKIVGLTPNFKDWGNIYLKSIVEEEFHIPFYLDNDANMAAFGEFEVGIGKQFKNMIYITLGTGIGGGIFIDGQLFRGSRFSGGEVGHITIDYDGIKCNCGGTGCWEQYASASALVRFYNLKSKKAISSAFEFFEKVRSGEWLAREILKDFYEYLAAGLASLINLFDPEAIIIGGGISESEWLEIEKIKTATYRRTMFQNDIRFLKAILGNKTGILGAANFARYMVTDSAKVS